MNKFVLSVFVIFAIGMAELPSTLGRPQMMGTPPVGPPSVGPPPVGPLPVGPLPVGPLPVGHPLPPVGHLPIDLLGNFLP